MEYIENKRNVDDIADWIRRKCDLTKYRQCVLRVRNIDDDSFELVYLPFNSCMAKEVSNDIVAALDPKPWNDTKSVWLLLQVSDRAEQYELARTILPYIAYRALK